MVFLHAAYDRIEDFIPQFRLCCFQLLVEYELTKFEQLDRTMRVPTLAFLEGEILFESPPCDLRPCYAQPIGKVTHLAPQLGIDGNGSLD